MGAVSALGHDCAALTAALEVGRSGIGEIRRFDTSLYSVRIGAEVKDWPSPALERVAPGSAVASMEERFCHSFAERAAREAVEQAGFHRSAYDSNRVAIVYGTNLGDIGRPVHELAVELGDALGFDGPRLMVCTACSSSTAALGMGRQLLLSGAADVVLAGGADVLTERVFAGFHALGVLNPDPCAPYSSAFGTTLGEGAGFAVLERVEHAAERSAEPLAFLTGFGLAGDGYHETAPDPGGRGVALAIRLALTQAGLTSEDVSYVNAHGSGTAANDVAEWRGIQRGLEPRTEIAVSSTKGALGHSQGAAGALETIATMLMMRRGLLPPTLHFTTPRPHAPPDPVPGPNPRPALVSHAISVNSGFGGSNAAVVVSNTETYVVGERAVRDIRILGMGLVTPGGMGSQPWSSVPETSPAVPGRVADFSLSDVDPRIDPRGLDRSSLFLTAAAALALSDAGLELKRADRDRAGLVLGSVRPSPSSLRAFDESIEDLGLSGVSAPAFARIVLNAPAGACTKLLGLHGPLTAVTTGPTSGLAAFSVACGVLRDHPDVSVMVASALDEATHDEPGHNLEGAACVALGVEGRSGPRVVGWSVAAPGRVRDAIGRMALETGFDPSRVDASFDAAQFGSSGSGYGGLPSMLALARAADGVRSGAIQRALVVADGGEAMSIAVFLEG